MSLARAVTPQDDPWHRSADAIAAEAAAREMLHDLSDRFLPASAKADEKGLGVVDEADRHRLDRAARAVQNDSVKLDRAREQYARQRSEWLPTVRAFRRDMLFE